MSFSWKTLTPWTTQTYKTKPRQIVKAQGSYLWDEEDKRYIDWTSGLMVVNLGHGNKEINEAILSQLSTGLTYVPPSSATKIREDLSELLLANSPLPAGRVYYTNAGADANEVAMFIALEAQKARGFLNRKKILSFNKSFHGGSTYVSSLMGGDQRKALKVETITAPVHSTMPNPSPLDQGEQSLKEIEDVFAKEHKNIAAILVEGSSGSAGCFEYPKGYFKKLETLSRKYEILLIVDEVMSGFGRTGKMFAMEHAEVIPDLITCAKGLSCGYIPLGAVVANKEISSLFDKTPLLTGLTYSGHPLACAAAKKCIEIYTKDKKQLLKESTQLGSYLYEEAKKVQEKHSSIAELRLTGLLGCFELGLPQRPDQAVPVEFMNKLKEALKERGVVGFMRANFMFMAPPINSSKALIDEAMSAIDAALSDTEKSLLL